MFEELNQHRAAVAENIQKACEIGFTGNELEKAHKVGDIHPNGKWVWTQLPSGRYDWRVIKKTSGGSASAAPATAQKKEEKKISISANHPALASVPGVNNVKEMLTTFNSKYTDLSKVKMHRTPKGNWDVSYDGHRLGILNKDQIKESSVRKMGWLEEDEKAKKATKVSPFVTKTIQMIKDCFGYGYNQNWTNEKVQKIQDVLIENEEVAKKIMGTAFPAAMGSSPMSANQTEIEVGGDTLIFGSYKTIDTTSRNPSFRGSSSNHYFIRRKEGHGGNLASGSSSGRWNTPAEVKSDCKAEALVRFLHIDLS